MATTVLLPLFSMLLLLHATTCQAASDEKATSNDIICCWPKSAGVNLSYVYYTFGRPYKSGFKQMQFNSTIKKGWKQVDNLVATFDDEINYVINTSSQICYCNNYTGIYSFFERECFSRSYGWREIGQGPVYGEKSTTLFRVKVNLTNGERWASDYHMYKFNGDCLPLYGFAGRDHVENGTFDLSYEFHYSIWSHQKDPRVLYAMPEICANVTCKGRPFKVDSRDI